MGDAAVLDAPLLGRPGPTQAEVGKRPAAAERADAFAASAAVSLAEVCGLLDAPLPSDRSLAGEQFSTHAVRRGECLYHQGDSFGYLYVVRAGMFKTLSVNLHGSEQVLAFHLVGNTMGVEGIETRALGATAVALQAGQVVVLPYGRLAQLAKEHAHVEHLLHRILAAELRQRSAIITLLGTPKADARLASFLLALCERLHCARTEFTALPLSMTFSDIGSHLGIRLETVSRAMSGMAADGLIEMTTRAVRLLDVQGLRARACCENRRTRTGARNARVSL